jgi:hypothetical protein
MRTQRTSKTTDELSDLKLFSVYNISSLKENVEQKKINERKSKTHNNEINKRRKKRMFCFILFRTIGTSLPEIFFVNL